MKINNKMCEQKEVILLFDDFFRSRWYKYPLARLGIFGGGINSFPFIFLPFEKSAPRGEIFRRKKGRIYYVF